MHRFLGVLLVVGSLATQASGDSGADLFYGTDGNSVAISGTETRSTPDGSGPHDRGTAAPGHPDGSTPCTPDPVRTSSCGIAAVKIGNAAGHPLTITDVAQFAPAPVTTAGEPGNVGVAGMPTNFVAGATAHTQAGTLFDRPITVRFTPLRFEFVHGDGTTATSSTGGKSWATLGQAPFTLTTTSHTYRQRGTHLAYVIVHYTAEVDIGGGWFSVPGELTIDGPAQQIRVYEADTALVARTCAESPGAPGC